MKDEKKVKATEEEAKKEVQTEDVKEKAKTEDICEGKKELTDEDLELVNGGATGPKVEGVIGSAAAAGIILKIFDE